MMETPIPSRWVLIAASAVALALAGCSSGGAAVTSGPPVPASASAPTAISTPSAPASAPASASASASAPASPPASGGTGGSGAPGAALQISAQGIQFSTKQLQAPAGKAFSIEFTNNDSGIQHNVNILDANNASIFKGAIFAGVATQTYQVPALKAGTYSFICDVHPTIMTGTLTVG